MLYLIGLGLDVRGISQHGLEAGERCEKVYLEEYTVNFPYAKEELEKVVGKKIMRADRDFVESLKILEEAKSRDIALLIYGSPLMATTHITLLQEAKKRKIRVEVIHNASILDAVSETGLQLYKLGKITSMPNFEADSYISVIRDNSGIGAHTLILVDIGMGLRDALEKLVRDSDKKNVKFDKIIICECLGLKNSKIYYGETENLKNQEIKKPFCIIIPGKLHFVEKEILEEFDK